MKLGRILEYPRLLAGAGLVFALVSVWFAVATYQNSKRKDEQLFTTMAGVLGQQFQQSFEQHTYFPMQLRVKARDLDKAALRRGGMMIPFPWQERLPHLLAMGYAETEDRKIIVKWKSEERVPVVNLDDDLSRLPGVLEAVDPAFSTDPNLPMGFMLGMNRMLLLFALPGNRSAPSAHGYIVAWLDLQGLCRDTSQPLLRDNILMANPAAHIPSTSPNIYHQKILDGLASWNLVVTRGPGFTPQFGAVVSVSVGLVPLLLVGLGWMQARQRLHTQEKAIQLIVINAELSRFKTIVETTSDLVAMCELDGTPIYMNPAGRTLLGFTEDEPLSAVTFDRVYSAEARALFAGEGFSHAAEIGPWNAEINMRHHFGHEIPVSFVGLIIKSADGIPLHMACMARDITVRRQLDLQQRETIEQQRELVQLKSQFVTTVSHEFRTPLGIILSGADLLDSYGVQLNPERRGELYKEIKDNTQHMTEMIENILVMGRIESSRARCNPERIDLSVMCREIAQKIKVVTPGSRNILVHSPDFVAMLDALLMDSILGNLLSNAVKYSPPDKPIVLTARSDKDNLVFTVRDEGIGIPADDVALVLDPFHRSSNVGEVPGTGLGLAITQRCVEMHGGTLKIESVAGHGTTVIVTIPII